MDEPTPAPRGQRCILIVEDEKNQRTMLSRAVREAEYEAQCASTGQEALRLLQQGIAPSIAMLDLNLPDMTGLELAQKIHQQWPAIQFIILTGYGTLEAAQQAIRLDVVDFLLKPTTLGELENAISRAWQKCLANRPLPTLAAESTPAPAPSSKTNSHSLKIADAERELIQAALQRHEGNRTAAAQELGISVRTLYYRLDRYESQDKISPPPQSDA